MILNSSISVLSFHGPVLKPKTLQVISGRRKSTFRVGYYFVTLLHCSQRSLETAVFMCLECHCTHLYPWRALFSAWLVISWLPGGGLHSRLELCSQEGRAGITGSKQQVEKRPRRALHHEMSCASYGHG